MFLVVPGYNRTVNCTSTKKDNDCFVQVISVIHKCINNVSSRNQNTFNESLLLIERNLYGLANIYIYKLHSTSILLGNISENIYQYIATILIEIRKLK